MQQLLLATLYGPLVDLVQVLLEGHFALQTVRSFLLFAKYNPDFFFQAISLVNLLGNNFRLLLDPNEEQLESILDSNGIFAWPAVHQKLGEVEDLLRLNT